MPVYDALYDFEDQLKHVLTRHEQGAVHAAQGYARVTGKVGVCIATSGPGGLKIADDAFCGVHLMPYAHTGLGFGQAIGVSSPVLNREVQGPYWSQYPADWQRGLAVRIVASPIPGGSPGGWNLVPVNLAKMLKRIERMGHVILERGAR